MAELGEGMIVVVSITINNMHKKYEGNDIATLKNFSLDIKDREFIVFVGPSGCGKSTTLRMIAGLEDITSGELYIGDELVNDVPPKDRDIAMVFQNYALYPHMTVYDNMGFGLKLRKFDKVEIDRRITEAADILGLTALLQRKPAALSGGQRQRVALGRAIVRDAKVFLMDEPLSNLDAKLRVAMRAEIAKLHRRLETTSIYVTHDQTEAMTMADRIVILNDGLIQQVGTPKEVYDYPENVFVAGFIGSPAMNFFNVTLQGNHVIEDGGINIEIPEGKQKLLNDAGYRDGDALIFGIRPEDIKSEQIAIDAAPNATLNVNVSVAELLGAETMVYCSVGEKEFIARVDAREDIQAGDQMELAFDLSKGHFFDPKTEDVIR